MQNQQQPIAHSYPIYNGYHYYNEPPQSHQHQFQYQYHQALTNTVFNPQQNQQATIYGEVNNVMRIQQPEQSQQATIPTITHELMSAKPKDDHGTKVQHDAEWASEFEIRVCCQLLECSIYVYSALNGPTKWYEFKQKREKRGLLSSKRIFLFHKNKNHYDLLVPHKFIENSC